MVVPPLHTPKISSLKLTPVFVPFTEAIKELMRNSDGGLGMAIKAEEPWVGGDFVICELYDEQGNVGVGEAFVWAPETGLSPDTIIGTIKHSLSRYVLGENPFQIEKINHRMNRNLSRNEVSKGLLDMAAYDLMGQTSQMPSHFFMGGAQTHQIDLCGLIPLTSDDRMIELAKNILHMGMTTIRVKLGRSIDDDRRIMFKIRETIGGHVRLRVDYNQAYSANDAVKAIKAIEPFNIEYAEQPVAADNFLSMAHVQQRVDTPIMAHEGCFGMLDIINLIEMNAVRVIGINGERPGGITQALKAMDYAAIRGLGVALHNQPLGIGSAAMLHLAAARHEVIDHAVELLGQVMLEDDLLVTPINYENGKAKLPSGFGWGVELDRGKLDKYATGPTITLTL